MHQSIPPVLSRPPPTPPPPPPQTDPRALAFILPWMTNSRGWGLLSCKIPRGGNEKRGQMPRPASTLQHFSLIARSNSAVLSILMCDILFQLTSSVCNSAMMLIKTSRRNDMHQFIILLLV